MAADEARPLNDRRIVVTRASEQSQKLIQLLKESGAQVISLPLVGFASPEDTTGLDGAIAALGDFDWIIFTSANAVRFFLGRCRTLGRWPSIASVEIAAVGIATRLALDTEGLTAAFVPSEFSGAALAAELAPTLAGKRVLLPRSDRAGEELAAALVAANAAVTAVEAYRTAPPERIDGTIVGSLQRGEADAVAFFSPSAFHNLVRSVGSDVAQEMSRRIAFAAVGPTTAAAIRAGGASVAVEASEATSEALVATLERYFADGRAKTGRIR